MKMSLVAGIDEAGRGPVIGPMVMAGVSIQEEHLPRLKALGVKDSKQLLPSVREELFPKILMYAESYKIITISPQEIDAALEDTASNLNLLEANTSSLIINFLKPERVYIDLPDKNPDRYKEAISKGLTHKEVQIIAEYKADVNYEIVSAASILAKVTRDRYIGLLKEQCGEDFGSGYTSDPKTQEFIRNRWNDENILFFRKRWATWQNMKRENDQKKLFDF
jgi:ribonuclease HII